MIICYTLPDIWHMTHVIVVFHFGLFLPFYHRQIPLPSPHIPDQKIKISKKKKKKEKTPGDITILHMYQQFRLDDARFLRYCARGRDRQTDGRTEKGTYRGGCPT